MSRAPGAIIVGANAMFGAKINPLAVPSLGVYSLRGPVRAAPH
jgi:hypothetical protein